MGYLLADMRALKTAYGFDLFVIWLDLGWVGGYSDQFKMNFDDLARRIEPNGVALVRCLFDAPLIEICQTYLNKDIDEIANNLPAILITNHLPENVNESTMRLLIPIRKLMARDGNIDEFLTELVLFSKNRDNEFLKRFEDKKSNFHYTMLKQGAWPRENNQFWDQVHNILDQIQYIELKCAHVITS